MALSRIAYHLPILSALAACKTMQGEWSLRPSFGSPDGYCNWPSSDPFERSRYHVRLGRNHFRLRVPIRRSAEAEQERADYCWAAAVQTVFAFHGSRILQSTVVRAISRGSTDDERFGATRSDILTAIVRLGPSLNRQVRTTSLQSSPYNVASDLAHGYPLIIGLRPSEGRLGHVAVLKAVEYCFSARGPAITEVEIFDPWPGEGERSIDGEQLRGMLDFAVRVWVV